MTTRGRLRTAAIIAMVALLGSGLLSGCGGLFGPAPGRGGGKADVVDGDTGPVPLISREVLFGNADFSGLRMNADWTRFALIKPVEIDGRKVDNIFVGNFADLDQAESIDDVPLTQITNDQGTGVFYFDWTWDGKHVIYPQDKDGDENYHVFSANVETGAVVDLTPFEGRKAFASKLNPDTPDEILIQTNKDAEEFFSLYRLNLTTGALALVEVNPGCVKPSDEGLVAVAMDDLFALPMDEMFAVRCFAGYYTDDAYNVRMAVVSDIVTGAQEYWVRDGQGGWDYAAPLLQVPPEDSMSTYFLAFDKSAAKAYFADARGRNAAALTLVDMQTGETEQVFEDPAQRADIEGWGLYQHPTEKTLQAVGYEYDRTVYEFFDAAFAKDFKKVQSLLPDGYLYFVDRTRQDDQWIIGVDRDDGPAAYYYYDRRVQDAKPRLLFVARKALVGLPLVKMQPIEIEAHDGTTLLAFLSKPKKGSGPFPLVLNVHGGPWARSYWGYSATHQWLANRGYAVLDVNFRGSTGLGKDFVNAGNHQWGAKMHTDLIDAVQWAIDEGIADPNAIAIMGGSYGGYAALVGMTFKEDTYDGSLPGADSPVPGWQMPSWAFACGVDIVGPSNLVTLLENVPPDWFPFEADLAVRVGDLETEQALLTRRSPLTWADRIDKPLLIAQGENDPRVKKTEAEQIVNAMQQNQIPLTYLLFPDEGHGFRRPENDMASKAVTEAFLQKCLGGRVEAFGAEMQTTSMTVPVDTLGTIPPGADN